MVLPMGAEAPMQVPPPPRELLKYRVPLVLVMTGYLAVLVVGLLAGGLTNVLNDFFVLLAAAFMVFNSTQCLGQCLLPFTLFAIMALFFDIISLIEMASQSRTFQHPGTQDLFSTSCPYDTTVKLLHNTTVYTVPANTPYLLPEDTKAKLPLDLCSWQWVAANVALFVSCFLDLMSSILGVRMFKVVRAAAAADDGTGLLGAGFGGLTGGPAVAPGDGTDGGQGGPGGMGGQGGGVPGPFAGRGQALGGAAAPGQPQRGPGFQPFQGGGRTLGGNAP